MLSCKTVPATAGTTAAAPSHDCLPSWLGPIKKLRADARCDAEPKLRLVEKRPSDPQGSMAHTRASRAHPHGQQTTRSRVPRHPRPEPGNRSVSTARKSSGIGLLSDCPVVLSVAADNRGIRRACPFDAGHINDNGSEMLIAILNQSTLVSDRGAAPGSSPASLARLPPPDARARRRHLPVARGHLAGAISRDAATAARLLLTPADAATAIEGDPGVSRRVAWTRHSRCRRSRTSPTFTRRP